MNMHVGGADAQRVAESRFKAGDKVVANRNDWGVEDGEEYTIAGYASSTSIGPWVYLAEISNRTSIDGSFLESGFSPAPLTIQAGKFYKTRDGRKVGPMLFHDFGDGEPWHTDDTIRWWSNDGTRDGGSTGEDDDLIAAWQDEPAPAYPDIAEATSGNSPAIVCRLDNGQPLPATRPHVHASVADASKEATRLAKANPGREFAVYEMVHTVQHNYEHEWQRIADTKPLGGNAHHILAEAAGISRKVALEAVKAYRAR